MFFAICPSFDPSLHKRLRLDKPAIKVNKSRAAKIKASCGETFAVDLNFANRI